MKQKVKKEITTVDKNGHSRKMDVEIEVTKLLGYSAVSYTHLTLPTTERV